MIVSQRPPFTSLITILLAVVVVGWLFVGQTIGIVVGSFIYDGDFLAAMTDPENHPEIKHALLFSQGIGSAIGLIFVPYLYLKTFERQDFSNFFKTERQLPMVMVIIFIIIISLSLAISPIMEWNSNIEFPEWMSGFGNWAKHTEDLAAELIKTITSNLTIADLILTFIVVAVIPALGEEIVFRGMIQTEMTRVVKNPHVGIWLSAILFSAIHLQFMGFVPRVLLGALFGYLYYWSGNLWIPILAHFFNNGFQVIALYLFQKGIITINLESAESAPLPMVAIALILTFAILYYLRNYFKSRSTASSDSF
ncbi:MAG: CPBP family intramembrane metalloprotease [Cyclobacteriaceae bacterium]|nr:CPBP family intramembrane metalloprotease [Cyclobacteriaceae bacterium]